MATRGNNVNGGGETLDATTVSASSSPPPSPDDAVQALIAVDTHGIHAIQDPDGLWHVERSRGGTTRRPVIRSAGRHPSPTAALLAGRDAILAGDTRSRQSRALEALDALSTPPVGAAYFLRPRDIANPDPAIGGMIRVWDVIKQGGGVTTILGRQSPLAALEDAAELFAAGTL